MSSGKPVCHRCKANFLYSFCRKHSGKNDADSQNSPLIGQRHPERISGGLKFEGDGKAEAGTLFFDSHFALNPGLQASGMSGIDLDHVAKQLCMIDAELMGNISWSELRNMGWIKSKTKSTESPNVLAMIRLSNLVGNRVISEVLVGEKLSFRVKTVVAFIKLAYKLWDLGNCNSSRIVVAALQDQSVYRLKCTWGGVSSKYAKIFDCLCRFFNPCSNPSSCQRYLDHRLEKGLPFIPFLGTFLTRVVYVISAKELAFDSSSHREPGSVMEAKRNEHNQKVPYSIGRISTPGVGSTEAENDPYSVITGQSSTQQHRQSMARSNNVGSSAGERIILGEKQERETSTKSLPKSSKSMDDTIFVSVSSDNEVLGSECSSPKADSGYYRTPRRSVDDSPTGNELEDGRESREKGVKDVKTLSSNRQRNHFLSKQRFEAQKCNARPELPVGTDEGGCQQHVDPGNITLGVPKIVKCCSRSDEEPHDSYKLTRLVGVTQKDFIFKSAFHNLKFQQQGNRGTKDYVRVANLDGNEASRQSQEGRRSAISPTFLFDDSDLDLPGCAKDASTVASNALRELKKEFKSYKVGCNRYQYSKCRVFRDFIITTKVLNEKQLYELSLSREPGHP